MKDIIITSQKIKRERNIYLICFLLSFAIKMENSMGISIGVQSTGSSWVEEKGKWPL